MIVHRYNLVAYIPHIVGGLALFYFLFHLVSGDRGLVSYLHAIGEYKLISTELSLIKEKNAVLENRIDLLKDDSVDYDMLEEQAMKTLGLAPNGDIVIFIKK